MTTAAIIQARHTSTRLPGKVVLPLAGVPVLTHIVERAKLIEGIDAVCIAVPDGPGQEPLVTLAEELAAQSDRVHVVFGPEDDLVKRYAIAIEQLAADTVMQLWGDCPLIDPAVVGALLAAYRRAGVPFATIPEDSGYPEGVEAFVMSADAILTADREATDPEERDAFHFFSAAVRNAFRPFTSTANRTGMRSRSFSTPKRITSA
jgi:spore coat polysaccharide biosynthesis protein SpsF (cytidylyltransferase family)